MRPLRLPPRALRQLAQLKSEHNRIWASEHREPTLTEGIEGEIGVLGDMIEDPLALDVYEHVLDSITGRQVRELLGRLNDREREIVDARFGFGDREPEPLAEIGELLGLSAERIRQIEQRALTKMRHAD